MPENEENIHDDIIIEKLIDLANHIHLSIKQSLEKKLIVPNKEQYIKWKIDKFEYSDKGVETGGSTGEHVIKDDWSGTAILTAYQFEKEDNIKKLSQSIKEKFGERGRHLFHNFIYEMVLQNFNNTFNEDIVKKLTNNFFKNLKDESKEYRLEAELIGITLRSKILKISDSISLRQTTKEDLEKEETKSEFDRHGFYPKPTAFLEIRMKTNNQNNLETKKRHFLNSIKLFKVGSIKFLKSRTFSEVMTFTGFGTLTSLDGTDALEIAVIKEGDEENLKEFISRLENKISENFGISNHNMSFGEIAFSRYVEALMKPNSLESRISDTMMGLESIYLQENAELSYRLRLRIAKIMSYFGFDPHETTRILVDAYEIRSQYVHGGLLDFKRREKLEAKYGNADNILKILFNFLRISIVITIFMHVDKDEFIARIDKSFIDPKSEGGVTQIISSAKQALGIQ